MSLPAAVSAAAPSPAPVVSGHQLPSDWNMARLAHAEFSHSGQDLRIVDTAGHELLVKGYFLSDTHSDLQLDGGMAFRAAWADRLSGGDGRLAQAAGNAAPAPSIGTVKTLNGTVTVEHADGTRSTLQVGDAVHQGDVLETGSGAAVGIVFLDGSNFSLGAGGKMVLDEMVYDPGTQSGSANVGVLSGTFAFISGQIAKTSPDAMKVTTPSATIGFRGTSGSGEVGGDGQTNIVLIRDPDGTIGEIVLVTPAGVFTLATVLQAAQVSINPAVPVVVQTMTPAEFAQQYGTVTSHLPAAAGNPGFVQGATQPGGPENQQDQQGQEGQSDQNLQQLQEQIQKQIQTPTPTPTPPETVIGDINKLIAILTPPVPPVTPDDPPEPVPPVTIGPGLGGLYTTAGSYTGTEGNDVMTFVGSGDVTFYGLAGNDVLTGYSGNDYLDGDAGNDILYGGAGNDHLEGDEGDDLIVSGTGTDVIDGGEGYDTLDYSSFTSAIQAMRSGASILIASTGSSDTAQNIELLIGTSGNDEFTTLGGVLIQGGAGNDTLHVQDGASMPDTFYGGDGTDFISFDDLAEAATIDVSAGTATWAMTSSLAFSGVEVIEGSDYNDTVTGSDLADTLYGSGGNDIINGGGGDDVIYGGSTDLYDYEADNKTDSNVLHGNDGNDTLHAGSGTSTVYGDAGNDTLYSDNANGASSLDGGTGNDTLVAGSGGGTIVMDGGGDTDTADFSGLSDGISVDYVSGYVASSETNGTYTLTSIEILKGTNSDDLLRSMGGVTVLGGGGNDIFSVSDLSGTDSFNGGTGADVLDFGSITTNITLNAGTGTATWGGGSYSLNFSEVEVFQGGSGADSLTGSSGNDTFRASAGNDAIKGEDGNDVADFSLLDGAALAVVGNVATISGDVNGTTSMLSIETLVGSSGNDTFEDTGGMTILGGGGNDTYACTSGTDVFLGGDGDDRVDFVSSSYAGLGGNDTFYGGDGTDTIDFSNLPTSDSVTISYNSGLGKMLATFSESGATVKMAEFENYTLSLANDTFTGSCGSESVLGAMGDDTFYASYGGDTYVGGMGDDTLDYTSMSGKHLDAILTTGDPASSIAIKDSNGDVLYTDTASMVETLVGTAGDDTFTFNSVDISAGAFAKVIGGAGDDTFKIAESLESPASRITIDGGDGDDILDFSTLTTDTTVDDGYVWRGAGSWSSGFIEYSNISVFRASAGAFTFTGGSGNETIYAGTGDAVIDGGDGNDTFFGGVGTDSFDGGIGDDVIDFSGLAEGYSVSVNGEMAEINLGQSSYGTTTFTSVETVIGSAGNDTMEVSTDTPDAYGLTYIGGDGSDTFSAVSGLAISATATTIDGVEYLTLTDSGESATFTVTGFETFHLGNGGDNTFSGTSLGEYVVGDGGNDTFYGNGGNDTLVAGDGNDSLDGGEGSDRLIVALNGSGNLTHAYDTGLTGTDTLEIDGTGAAHIVISGQDIAFYDGSENVIGHAVFNNGIDVLQLSSVKDEYAGDSNDNTVIFGGGNDTVAGNGGDDTFYADLLAHNDHVSIDGGSGSDTLSLENLFSYVGANLNADTGSFSVNLGTEQTGYGTFSTIETFRLTNVGDTFTASSTAATTVFGLDGNDDIACGTQADTIGFEGSGTSLENLFLSMGIDSISGFTSGTDTILLDTATFDGVADASNIATDDSTFGGDLGITGAAVFIYQDGSNYELWYTTAAENADESNSYQFATSDSLIQATDIQLASTSSSSGVHA